MVEADPGIGRLGSPVWLDLLGYLRTLIVAYPTPSGKILLGTGPVFSQYEWKQPMSNRLTDEAWREKLKSQPPDEHSWTKSFREPKAAKGSKGKKQPAKVPPFTGCWSILDATSRSPPPPSRRT